MIRRLFCMLAALLLLASVLPAAVATSGESEAEAITVLWDKGTPNEDYILFLLSEGTDSTGITSENVLFMDQVTADSEGAINVLFIAPDFESCEICLAGNFPDGGGSPRIIGHYSSEVKALHTPIALTQIDEEAFEGCTFTHVYLGESVKKIGSKAFADCAELQYIEIPAMTVTIADNAFFNSTNVVIGCKANSDAYRFAVNKGISYRILEG